MWLALEHGRFWQLTPIPQDKLGKSVAELNGVQSIMENTQHLANFSSLVKVMQVIQCITDFSSKICII